MKHKWFFLRSLSIVAVSFAILHGCASTPEKPESNPLGLRYDHTVKLEIASDNYNNVRVFAQGDADGEGIRFMLDTGAYKSAVRTSGVFSKYPVSSHESSTGLYSTRKSASIDVKSIRLDSEKLDIHSVRLISEDEHQEGVIGIDAFRDRSFVLDFHNPHFSRISLDESFTPGSLTQSMRLLLNDQRIVIDGQFDQEKISMLFDTGASHSFVSPQLIAKYPNAFRFLSYRYVKDINGEGVKETNYLMKNLRVGAILIQEAYVTTMSRPEESKAENNKYDILFGAKQMQKFHWAFDMKQKLWTVW